MSKWQQREEQQVSGTDESTPSVSRCHQVSQKHIWISQVYQDITNLTLTQHSAQVVLLVGVNMTMIMKVKDFKWKESFPDAIDPDHESLTILLDELNHRLETYNLARPWTGSEPRCQHRTPLIGPVAIPQHLPGKIGDRDRFHLQETLVLQLQTLLTMQKQAGHLFDL